MIIGNVWISHGCGLPAGWDLIHSNSNRAPPTDGAVSPYGPEPQTVSGPAASLLTRRRDVASQEHGDGPAGRKRPVASSYAAPVTCHSIALAIARRGGGGGSFIQTEVAVSNSNSSSGGIGFVGLLTIVFIVLKLCKVIDWSWWWVASPIWITVGALLAAVVIAVLVAVGVEACKK